MGSEAWLGTWVYISILYVCGPLLTSGELQTEARTDNGGNDVILSQNVHGEFIISYTTCQELSVTSPSFSAGRTNYLQLFRKHISRKAAGKGRAVLEGVWLDAATIGTCFRDNPLDEEAAVQAGLTKWVEGKGRQPPTWAVLLEAMEYAEIAQEHVQSLKTDLGLH